MLILLLLFFYHIPETNTPVWLYDYSFGDKYMSDIAKEDRAITGDTIANITEMMISPKNTAWSNYIQHRQVNYQPDPYSRYALYCSARHVTNKNYDACIKAYPVRGG